MRNDPESTIRMAVLSQTIERTYGLEKKKLKLAFFFLYVNTRLTLRNVSQMTDMYGQVE